MSQLKVLVRPHIFIFISLPPPYLASLSTHKPQVTGGGGFIGSHLAKRLKEEGNWVRCADWKKNEYFKEDEFCNEFLQVDLRDIKNCEKACEGIDWVYNLAADMGGMGFIQSNHSVKPSLLPPGPFFLHFSNFPGYFLQ